MLARVPKPLRALLAVAALLTLAWSFTTGPLLAPDEPQHYNYAQHLAETGKRPNLLLGPHADSTVTGTALTFFNIVQTAGDPNGRPGYTRAEQQRWPLLEKALDSSAYEDGGGPNALAKNPPLYYAYEVVPYHVGKELGGFFGSLWAMRLASGLLFLITIALTWLIASELFASTLPRVVATGFVALLPEMGFLSGAVNADNLLICIWTAFVLMALRLVRHGPTTGRTLALFALAAASLLTHGRGTAILFPLVIVVLVAYLRQRRPLRRTLIQLGAGVAVVAAVYSAYRLFASPTGGAYGGEVTFPTGAASLGELLSSIWQFYLPKLPLMSPRVGPAYGYRQVVIETLFGTFGSVDTRFSRETYDLIQGGVALLLVACAAGLVAHRHSLARRWPELVVLASTTAGMLTLLHAASYRALLFGTDPLITGRYLLPLAPIFGCGIAFVVWALPRRVGVVVSAVVLASLVALTLGGLGISADRFYG